MSHHSAVSVVGKTLRFTFEDGPMAGKSFDHVFEKGGGLRFHEAGAKGDGTAVKKCETATIGADVVAVSYLGPQGYTLTAVLDYRTKTLVAFSSNDKMHLMQRGTFAEVSASPSEHAGTDEGKEADQAKKAGAGKGDLHTTPHR